jgi:hypothetical protein
VAGAPALAPIKPVLFQDESGHLMLRQRLEQVGFRQNHHPNGGASLNWGRGVHSAATLDEHHSRVVANDHHVQRSTQPTMMKKKMKKKQNKKSQQQEQNHARTVRCQVVERVTPMVPPIPCQAS